MLDDRTRSISLAVAVIAVVLWLVVYSGARLGARAGTRAALADQARERRSRVLRLPTKP